MIHWKSFLLGVLACIVLWSLGLMVGTPITRTRWRPLAPAAHGLATPNEAYSSVHCVGTMTDIGKLSADDKVSCDVSHLCRSADGHWRLYHAHAKTDRAFNSYGYANSKQSVGVPLSGYPQRLGLMPQTGPDSRRWLPLEHRYGQRIPPNYTVLPGTYVLGTRMAAANYGHLLYETALPMFALMQLFGAAKVAQSRAFASPQTQSDTREGDVHFLFLDDCMDAHNFFVIGVRSPHPSNKARRQACLALTKKIFGLMSGHEVLLERQINSLAQADKRDGVCFQRTLGGINDLTFSTTRSTWKGMQGRAFRDFVYARHGVRHDSRSVHTLRVLVGHKAGFATMRRGIHNGAAIVDWLKELGTFQSLSIDAQMFDPTAISPVAKLRLLAQTDVFISPGGAISFDSLYLPDEATCIHVPWCGPQASVPLGVCKRNQSGVDYCCMDGDVNVFHYWMPHFHTMVYEARPLRTEVGGPQHNDVIVQRKRLLRMLREAFRVAVLHRRQFPLQFSGK